MKISNLDVLTLMYILNQKCYEYLDLVGLRIPLMLLIRALMLYNF